MEILPAIDLRNGKCVRLLQGDYDRQIDYRDDPVGQAREFEQLGAKWLHVVDLDGAREGKMANAGVIAQIIENTELNVEVGGGVREEETIQTLLQVGVRQIIIGTRALEEMDWFEQMVRKYEGQIVLGLDARDGILRTRGWTEASNLTALAAARKVSDWPLAAIVYTDIARDGMLTGPNVEATREMAEKCNVPIIASGGMSTLADVEQLAKLELFGIIIGRAYYEGTINLREAVRIVER